MWRAALPCRQIGVALLGSILAFLAVAASPSNSSAAVSAPTGQIWALALPDSVKTVQQPQLNWLAGHGVTTIVATKLSQKSLQQLAASAKRAHLTVIAPKQVWPKKACASTAGVLRTCAALAVTPAAAVKLARRSLVDYVVIRVRTPKELRMLRGSGAKRSRIVAVLPLNRSAAGRAAWRAGVAYAAADAALDLGVGSTPRATSPLGSYLAQVPRTRTGASAGPAAPTSLLVTGRSTSSVTLRWTAAAGSVEGYGVYTDGASVLSITAVSITLTGLQCGRSYTFAVDAFDAGGARSGRTSTVTSTDACPGSGGGGGGVTDALPPSAPLGLAKGSSTQSSISVSWTTSTDNVGVAGYGMYRGGSAVGSSTVSSFSFSGLACGTTYTLGVDAYDAAGNRSGLTSISAATSACAAGGDTSAPAAPGTLSKTGSTATSISVSWGASTDNVGVTGYGLYRNTTSTGSTAATSATFTGLACGSSYALAVDAYDAAGNRSGKTALTTATAACPPSSDTTAPSVPQGMAFGATTQTTVALVWSASTDNVGVAGYSLFRNGASVATVATPGYTFTGLTCGTSYTFALEAYDAAGNTSDGAQASGSTTTAACSGSADSQAPSQPSGLVASGVTASSVTLSWSASSDNVGVSGYGRYRNGTLLSTGTGTSFSFTGLACGSSYTLAVDAYDAAGNRSNSASTSATTSACPPGGGGSASAYLSPSGSDSNACTQAAPCKSFDRAYRVAAPGATVELAAGSYPAQTLTTDSSKTSASDVVFRPASGASVTLGDLTILADHLELRDLTVNNSVSTKTSADDVTLRNLDMLGIFLEGSSNVSVLGGRVHCGYCSYHSQISAESGVNVAPTNVLIDGVLFEDWQAAVSGQHTECLQIGGGIGITIRNSTFRKCATATPNSATSNIHVSWYGTGPETRNVTIENNFIYESGNPFSIQAVNYPGLRIRYNSIVGPIVVFGGQGDGIPVEITGNILGYTAGMCDAQPLGSGSANSTTDPLTWRYNVISGGTCGGTDRNAVYGYTNQDTDLHLGAGAAAINAGDPTSYPSTDIDGNTRSAGTPDAGADER